MFAVQALQPGRFMLPLASAPKTGLKHCIRMATPGPAPHVLLLMPAATPQSVASGSSRGAGLDEAAGAGAGRSPEHLAWWRSLRLRLWRYSDRLEVIYAAQGRCGLAWRGVAWPSLSLGFFFGPGLLVVVAFFVVLRMLAPAVA